MVSFYREARDGAQQIRFLAVARKMLDGLADEDRGLLPRALVAEQRHERRLAGARILPGALARRGFVPLWSIKSSAIWKARPMLRA